MCFAKVNASWFSWRPVSIHSGSISTVNGTFLASGFPERREQHIIARKFLRHFWFSREEDQSQVWYIRL